MYLWTSFGVWGRDRLFVSLEVRGKKNRSLCVVIFEAVFM